LHYRRDIDGLRAIAILPVVLFHSGVRQVPGGFVGVDIFFVISGYLITSLITEEIARGQFTVISFYERRVRRIFPALFTVLALSVIAATLLFLPEDFRPFARSLAATALFFSNMYFYTDSNYFAALPDTKPLLHTWSLAVEEQFYIVFPLLLIIAFAWCGRRWIGLLLVIFILSLITSMWMSATHPGAAFYFAPMRAWELMLGALVAASTLPTIKSQHLRELFALAGLALIAWAVFGFTSTTPFPGWRALVPCAGAALLIYAGEDDGSSAVGRMLSWQPVIFVGLISYSLYLWHWPLLVFARYWNIDPLTAPQVVAVIVASFVLATLTWKLVEQPFRLKVTPVARRPLFFGAATATAAAVVFSIVGVWSHGFPGRFSPLVVAVAKQAETPGSDEQLRNCIDRPAAQACDYGASVKASYAVWGDSHASALLPAIGRLAKRYGKAFKIFIHDGCPPVIGLNRISKKKKKDPDCLPENDEIMQSLELSPDIRTVILISRYALYVRGSDVNGADFGPNFREPLVDSFGRVTPDVLGRRALFERQLDLTIDRLFAAGKSVVLVYPVPEVTFDVPRAVVKLMGTKRDPTTLSVPLSSFHKREDIVFAMLDRIGGRGKVVRVYPHKRLCDAKRCVVYAKGSILYRDDNHLSAAGAAYVQPELEAIFANAISVAESRLAE